MLPRSGGYAQKTPPSCKLQSGVICATLPIAKRKMQGVDMIEDLIDGLEQGWKDALADFMRTPDGIAALDSLDTLLDVEPVNYHPSGRDIFKAFRLTPFDRVRVVIIGQDPYPDINKATGVAFSMPMPPPDMPDDEVKLSPSIKRIYKAIENDDVPFETPNHGNLECWAERGVLLLNRALTFRKCNRCATNIHRHHGWEAFTEAVVNALLISELPIHFILWGNEAKNVKKYINRHDNGEHHIVLESRHPTPRTAAYIREFLYCGHFSVVRENAREGELPISWLLPARPRA